MRERTKCETQSTPPQRIRRKWKHLGELLQYETAAKAAQGNIFRYLMLMLWLRVRFGLGKYAMLKDSVGDCDVLE